MTLQQLKYVITVAERGSITEAAKDLYISQPSLSGAVKEVEKEAGLMIFNRCRAGVSGIRPTSCAANGTFGIQIH